MKVWRKRGDIFQCLSFWALEWHIFRYFCPQINIDSCLLFCEGLRVTGGQRAFTALSLPINVFPTNQEAAGRQQEALWCLWCKRSVMGSWCQQIYSCYSIQLLSLSCWLSVPHVLCTAFTQQKWYNDVLCSVCIRERNRCNKWLLRERLQYVLQVNPTKAGKIGGQHRHSSFI